MTVKKCWANIVFIVGAFDIVAPQQTSSMCDRRHQSNGGLAVGHMGADTIIGDNRAVA